MVKIRLTRVGGKKKPYYRIVVCDERSPRDGKFIEIIGRYDPRQEPSLMEVDKERALYRLGTGARPTPAVERILEITGVMSEFKAAKTK